MANRAEWQERVSEWRASGLTAAQFCEGREFSRSALHWWSGQLRTNQRSTSGARADQASPSVAMARVETGRASVEALTIEIGSARIVVPRGVDHATLACALRALKESAQ